MEQTKTNDLGTKPVGKLLLSLALPAIAAQLVNMLYNIVDRMYIGHIPEIGATALTGVGVAFPIIMVISAFSALIGMGGAPLASIKMGEKDRQGARGILGNCFIALFILSLLLMVLFFIFGKDFLLMFGASQNTIDYALGYLNIYLIGTPFVLFALGLNAFISAQGFAKTSMMTVLIGAVINIILDPVFIFLFGMGVQGAALATIISQAISAFWVLRFLSGEKSFLRLRKDVLHFSWSVLLPVLALGVSPFIMQSTESLLSIVLNSSLQRYGGDLAVGSMTILTSIMQVLLMPLMGLTQGAQPIISYNYGARQTERVRQAFRLLLISCISYTLIFWLSVMLLPQIFIALFTSQAQLSSFSVWAVRIYLGAAFMMGAQIACQQTFIAVGQAKISLFLALLRKIFLLIPLIYILPCFFADKVFAVFLAEPIADALATCTTLSVFIFKFKKLLTVQVTEGEKE